MLYIAESDESDVESVESRDASSFEDDAEISSLKIKPITSSNFDLGFHWIMRRREKSSQVSFLHNIVNYVHNDIRSSDQGPRGHGDESKIVARSLK